MCKDRWCLFAYFSRPFFDHGSFGTMTRPNFDPRMLVEFHSHITHIISFNATYLWHSVLVKNTFCCFRRPGGRFCTPSGIKDRIQNLPSLWVCVFFLYFRMMHEKCYCRSKLLACTECIQVILKLTWYAKVQLFQVNQVWPRGYHRGSPSPGHRGGIAGVDLQDLPEPNHRHAEGGERCGRVARSTVEMGGFHRVS